MSINVNQYPVSEIYKNGELYLDATAGKWIPWKLDPSFGENIYYQDDGHGTIHFFGYTTSATEVAKNPTGHLSLVTLPSNYKGLSFHSSGSKSIVQFNGTSTGSSYASVKLSSNSILIDTPRNDFGGTYRTYLNLIVLTYTSR